MRSSLQLFREHVLAFPAGFVLLAVLLLVRSALLLYGPLLVADFILLIQAGAEVGELQRTALVFMAVALGQVIAGVLMETTAQRVGWNDLRDDLIGRVLSERPGQDAHSASEFVERIEVDASLLSRLFSSLLPKAMTSLVLTAGAVVITSMASPLAGAVVFGYVLLSVAMLWWTKRITDRHVLVASNVRTEVFREIGDLIAARESVGVNSEDRGLRRMLVLLRSWFPVRHTANRAATSMWTSSIAVYGVAATMMLLLAPLLGAGAGTVALVVLVVQYMDTVRRPLEQLREEMQALPEAQAGATRVMAFKALFPDLRAPEAADTGERPPAHIVFTDVAFQYADGTAVLDGLNLDVPAGGVLALTGRTGSGKSTVLRLLLGELRPSRGRIEISGEDPADLGPESSARLFGTVGQETVILPGTLRENLTLFSDRVSDEQLTDTLRHLGLTGWLDRYPQGWDHRVSGSADLAAGEARIIALFRAMMRRPAVLVLDEVTAGLDDEWASVVEQAVERLSGDSTVVLATHSPTLNASATERVRLAGPTGAHTREGEYVD